MIERLARGLGSWALTTVRSMGHMFIFFVHAVYRAVARLFKHRELLREIWVIRTKSMTVILHRDIQSGHLRW